MGPFFVELIASLNEFGEHQRGDVGVLDRPAHHGDVRMMTFVVVVTLVGVTVVRVMHVVAVPVAAATGGRGPYFDLTPLHRRGHGHDERAHVLADVEQDWACRRRRLVARACVSPDRTHCAELIAPAGPASTGTRPRAGRQVGETSSSGRSYSSCRP